MITDALPALPEQSGAFTQTMHKLFAEQAAHIEPAAPLAIQPPPLRMLVFRTQGSLPESMANFFERENILQCGGIFADMDFLAAMNLAALYAADAPDIDSAVTLTCIVRGNGAALVRRLREEYAIPIDEIALGVYRLCGGALPAQIIDLEYLPPDEHHWINALIAAPTGSNLRLIGRPDICGMRNIYSLRKRGTPELRVLAA
jgi:hypothetical protein